MNADKLREQIRGAITEYTGFDNVKDKLTEDILSLFLSSPSELPERKEYIALLSYKEINLTGELIEGRTIQGWIDFGFNSCLDIAEVVVAKKNARIEELGSALAFAQSVIQSGEKWTETCDKIIGKALEGGGK